MITGIYQHQYRELAQSSPVERLRYSIYPHKFRRNLGGQEEKNYGRSQTPSATDSYPSKGL